MTAPPPKATNSIVMFPRENNSDKIQERSQRKIMHMFNQLSAFRENTNKHLKELKEDRNKMTEAQETQTDR